MNLDFSSTDLLASMPLIIISGLALILMMLSATKRKNNNLLIVVALVGLVAVIAAAVYLYPFRIVAYHGMLSSGAFASVATVIFCFACGLTVILSKKYFEQQKVMFGELYPLLIFATAGMIMIASAMDLIMIFLGIELMSICVYILAGFFRKRWKSNEAALKYFLLGAFATGFLLYGIALMYGAVGSTNLSVIMKSISGLQQPFLFWIGSALMLIGLGFKVAAVPFHMWVPDVYEGAPTPISGFMSTGIKAAGFSAIILIFSYSIANRPQQLIDIFAFLSAASMIVGNVMALAQSNIKRMLAYSSVAHAGYMLSGLTGGGMIGAAGVLYYLTAYVFMNVGAFGVVSILERSEDKNVLYDDFNGLWFRKPILALFMAAFMFSLAGIPPFAGFFGKFYVFAAAINGGYTWLAIVGVVASILSVYYYLRVVVVMFFRDPTATEEIDLTKFGISALAISAVILLIIGMFPGTVSQFTQHLF